MTNESFQFTIKSANFQYFIIFHFSDVASKINSRKIDQMNFQDANTAEKFSYSKTCF